MILLIIGCFLGIGFTVLNLLILMIMTKLYTEVFKDDSMNRRFAKGGKVYDAGHD